MRGCKGSPLIQLEILYMYDSFFLGYSHVDYCHLRCESV